MVLSRRERYTLVGMLIAVGALALDRLAISPLLNQRSASENQRARLALELTQAKDMILQRRQLGPRWQEMLRTGMKTDPAEAESQILHAVNGWAEESRLSLTLLKPERLTEKTPLPGIAFQAAGTGSLRGVARLLWRIQTATIPIKVTEAQISARKEGTDDLSFQLRLSTVYSPLPSPTTAPSERPGAPGGR